MQNNQENKFKRGTKNVANDSVFNRKINKGKILKNFDGVDAVQ